MAKGFSIRAWLGLDTKQFSKGMRGARGGLTKFQKGLRGVNDTLRGLKFAAISIVTEELGKTVKPYMLPSPITELPGSMAILPRYIGKF